MEPASDVFGGGSRVKVTELDIKALHTKIGQITLENDFLESALTKTVVERDAMIDRTDNHFSPIVHL
jgi:hypothetical protein